MKLHDFRGRSHLDFRCWTSKFMSLAISSSSHASPLSLATYRFGIENGRMPSCEHSWSWCVRGLIGVSCKFNPMMAQLRVVSIVFSCICGKPLGAIYGFATVFTFRHFPDAFLFHFIPHTPTSICTNAAAVFLYYHFVGDCIIHITLNWYCA